MLPRMHCQRSCVVIHRQCVWSGPQGLSSVKDHARSLHTPRGAGEADAGGALQLLAGQSPALESLLACMQRGWMCLLVGMPGSGRLWLRGHDDKEPRVPVRMEPSTNYCGLA